MLRGAGLKLKVGKFSLRLTDFGHFVNREYGGDLGEPQFDVDGDDVVALTEFCDQVSKVLAANELRHRFEIYSDEGDLVTYLHHRWPISR